MEDKLFYGNNISVLRKDGSCTVYEMKDTAGRGTMTRYRVFPGMDLIYNDFHMQSCISEFRPRVELLGIDHCREGRIEWEYGSGAYTYMQEGDLQINTRENHCRAFGFPLCHYHGITVAVYLEEALENLPTVLGGFEVDLYALREKFCTGEKPFIMRADSSIQHVFSALYAVSGRTRESYFKLKVLELLLLLSDTDVPEKREERPYFPRKQVETVKSVMKHLTANLDKHFTLEELSSKFNISLTSLKLCFKGVYGESVYSYMRSYRIQTAALMLRKSNENITAVAGKVGYHNPSKFAAAFKEIMGTTPAAYQKNSV